jgi:hypothetical protein
MATAQNGWTSPLVPTTRIAIVSFGSKDSVGSMLGFDGAVFAKSKTFVAFFVVSAPDQISAPALLARDRELSSRTNRPPAGVPSAVSAILYLESSCSSPSASLTLHPSMKFFVAWDNRD